MWIGPYLKWRCWTSDDPGVTTPGSGSGGCAGAPPAQAEATASDAATTDIGLPMRPCPESPYRRGSPPGGSRKPGSGLFGAVALHRVAFQAGPVEERAERAGQRSHHGDRPDLEEDVDYPGARRDRVRELGRDRQELRGRPEHGVAEVPDARSRRVALEVVLDQRADDVDGEREHRDRHEPLAEVEVRRRRRARDRAHLAHRAIRRHAREYRRAGGQTSSASVASPSSTTSWHAGHHQRASSAVPHGSWRSDSTFSDWRAPQSARSRRAPASSAPLSVS